jgi:aryl-alcohol dehydrogenase-like predicted oxidoreductase
MQYRTLGRTGLRVSLLGLGTGGASMLGQGHNLPRGESTRLVRRALDAGVNMIDTAPGYGQSELLLGEALDGVPRDQYILTTKFQPFAQGHELYPASDLRASLEQSLRALRTEYVDVLYLHGVGPDPYAEACVQLVPEMMAARAAGLVRSLGITERYQSDHKHAMATRAIPEDIFDVFMVGLNLMSPAAVTSVLPLAASHSVGIVVMCAVRSVLIHPQQVKDYVRLWQAEGRLQPGTLQPDGALDWVLDDDTQTITSAAYKFAAAHPAVGSVLTGTGNVDHFEDNLKAILGPPLPGETFQRLIDVFGPVQRNIQPPRTRAR